MYQKIFAIFQRIPKTSVKQIVFIRQKNDKNTHHTVIATDQSCKTVFFSSEN